MISADEWAERTAKPRWDRYDHRIVSRGCWSIRLHKRGVLTGKRLNYRWISQDFDYDLYVRVVKAKARNSL